MKLQPMFRYVQGSGDFETAAGEVLTTGYSGKGAFKNDISAEHVRGWGPIPRGLYRVHRAFVSEHMGPVCLPLEPWHHDALGRSGFYIHGDTRDHDASRGCIILPPEVRKRLDKDVKTFRHVLLEVI